VEGREARGQRRADKKGPTEQGRDGIAVGGGGGVGDGCREEHLTGRLGK